MDIKNITRDYSLRNCVVNAYGLYTERRSAYETATEFVCTFIILSLLAHLYKSKGIKLGFNCSVQSSIKRECSKLDNVNNLSLQNVETCGKVI